MRSSWLMLARKELLARLALSAASMAASASALAASSVAWLSISDALAAFSVATSPSFSVRTRRSASQARIMPAEINTY